VSFQPNPRFADLGSEDCNKKRSAIHESRPVVLQKGAILKISVWPGNAMSQDARLFAQVSGVASEDAAFRTRPDPGVIVARGVSAGPRTVRAIQFDSDGSAWFSDVIPITAVAGQTNEGAGSRAVL